MATIKLFSKSETNMTEGNLFKKIFLYSIPLILSALLQLFYNACDLIICGKFGSPNSVGAISATNSFISLIVNLFIGISTGANVVMARAYGANDKEKGQKVVYTSIAISLIAGIFVAILGVVVAKPSLRLLNTPSEVIDLSSQYLLIYFLGVPFSLFYNFGASIMRATGDSRRPFICLFISGIVNVLLNLLFVIPLNMDVIGVALATIISQAISACLVLFFFLKNKGFFEFKIKHLRIYVDTAKEILVIGLPAGIQSSLFSISNVFIQSSINQLANTFSLELLNGNGASSSLEGFMYVCQNQVAVACTSFVSANYGAKKMKNVKKCVFFSLLIASIMWLTSFSIIFPLRKQLMHLYGINDEAYSYGVERLTLIISTYFLCVVMDITGYLLIGLGYSLVSMLVTVIGIVGFRFFWIFVIFPRPKMFSLPGLILSYPLSWVLVFLILIVLDIVIYKKISKKLRISNE